MKFSVVLIFLLLSPALAWGYVPHEYPAIYTHQLARIFLFISFLLVLRFVIRNGLHRQGGWKYISLSLCFFVIWDLNVFVGRIAEIVSVPQTIGSTEGWQYFTLTIDIQRLEYFYYLGRLDFVLLNVAMLLFYAGLRQLLRKEQAEASATVLLPLFPILVSDMIGNSLFIVLSVLSFNCAIQLYRKDRENVMWNYMMWLSFSWLLFSLSRSFGHILRHILIPTGYQDIWKFFEPVTGSLNSLALFFVGSVSLFFIRIYKSYLVITEDKHALERLVSERTKFIEQLKEDKIELQELDRLKSAFLANVSHELRTPMNSIMGYTEVLLDRVDGPLTPDQERSLLKVRGNAKHLLKLIEDVLNISKIESGKMELDVRELDINVLIQSVVSSFEPLVERKELGLVVNLDRENRSVYGDEERVRTILVNLMSNAVKFTRKGMITVTSRKSAESSSFLEICIEDTGIGIKEENLTKIFDKFHQVDFTAVREYEGTGLGLSIARGLVSLHKGFLRVTSKYGEGSRFCFALPMRRDVFGKG
ncbi:MAG: HAMP domain-containing sensor histidine kinase [Nitrospirota bacterium]